MLLGKSYLKLRDFSSASKSFERAANLNPNRLESQYYASYSSKLNKDFQKAEYFGKIAYTLDKSYLNNLINLADIYKNLNQSEEAKKFAERALVIDPNHPILLKLTDVF
nr:tetratricopeptide repeat protein [Leptospira selangorensis]